MAGSASTREDGEQCRTEQPFREHLSCAYNRAAGQDLEPHPPEGRESFHSGERQTLWKQK